jgi:hypothetical protein
MGLATAEIFLDKIGRITNMGECGQQTGQTIQKTEDQKASGNIQAGYHAIPCHTPDKRYGFFVFVIIFLILRVPVGKD